MRVLSLRVSVPNLRGPLSTVLRCGVVENWLLRRVQLKSAEPNDF